MTVDEFFAGFEDGKKIFSRLRKEFENLGDTSLRVSKSQIAVRRTKAFAWVWTPRRHLKGNRKIAPLVLSLAFASRDPSQRWKEIVEPTPGRFMHHLEMWSADDVDDQVRDWLRKAWDAKDTTKRLRSK